VAAQTIANAREATAATPGNSLTLLSGGAKLAGTDLAGGDLVLSGGTATGMGESKIIFKGAFPQASTNTTDNAPAEVGRITGGGYVQFTGTSNSGDTMLPATGTATPGAGARMVWYPRKAAFRAGDAGASAFDDANIGAFSAGFGSNPIVSGATSFAWGNNPTASGDYSMAGGYTATASGSVSTALGFLATASNSYAFAEGYSTTASGNSSVAMGASNLANGGSSMAMGQYTTAAGAGSTALGSYVMAGNTANTNGNYSMAIGLTSTSTATYPTVTGTGSLMIAMQDQHNVVMSANNAMALLGGTMIINPGTGGGVGTVSTPSTALDVRGSIMMGNGGETCASGNFAGAIRYSGGAVQFCNGTAWANISSGGGGTPGGSNTQVQYNNSSAFGASSDFTWNDSSKTLTVDAANTTGATLAVGVSGANTNKIALGPTTGAAAPTGTAVATVTVQTFTATGAYTPHAGLIYCTVEVVGSGGGGGGGGGGYARKTFPAATCSGFATVGAVGTAGANTGTAGGAGGTSCFSTLTACGGTINLQATGGAGGSAPVTGQRVKGGAGGVGTLGDLNGGFCISPRKGIVGIMPPEQWRGPWAFRSVLE
jgi:trimeric autotransporter adhesin